MTQYQQILCYINDTLTQSATTAVDSQVAWPCFSIQFTVCCILNSPSERISDYAICFSHAKYFHDCENEGSVLAVLSHRCYLSY